MQPAGVAAVDVRELQLVHEVQDAVICPLDGLRGKVPVHCRVQLGLGERGGDRRQFRQTNEAAQANDARKEGAIWGFGARIFALPVFEGLQEMREAVDSGQDFQEGDVSLLWKDAQEREMGRLLHFRRGQVPAAILFKTDKYPTKSFLTQC